MRIHRRTDAAPRDTIVYLVRFNGTLKPGLTASAYLVKLLPAGTYYEQTTDEVTVFDARSCNFYIPGEYGETLYDGETDRFIPVGSYGLLRRAKLTSNISAGSFGTGNIVASNGAVITAAGVTIYYRWSDNAPLLMTNAEVWVQYLTDDQVWEIIPSGDGTGGDTLIRVKPNTVLQPGGSVVASVYEWSGSAWVDDVGNDITIHDEKTANCVFTSEFVDVVLNAQSGQYEIVGSHGLTRRAVANATIAINSFGSSLFKTTGGATAFTADAHLKWMHGGEQVSNGSEMLCLYLTDEQYWLIIGAECE